MEHQPTNRPHHERHAQDNSQEQHHSSQPAGEVPLGQYLTTPTAPDTRTEFALPAEVEDRPRNPQIEEGIREQGDAFRAYLQLPDINLHRDDLLQTFREFYIGEFISMEELLDELTEIRDWTNALHEVARRWGIEGMVSLDRVKIEAIARETWDIRSAVMASEELDPVPSTWTTSARCTIGIHYQERL